MPPKVPEVTWSPSRYVLLASNDLALAARWLTAVGEIGAETRIVRDAESGFEMLARSGSPILLITDLVLPKQDGFALAEALRRQSGPDRAVLIGVSKCRDTRELARRRSDLGFAAVLPVTDLDALRLAALRALRWLQSPEPQSLVPAPAPEPSPIELVIREVADEAARLTAASGVAVYLQAGSFEKFRASVTWTAERPDSSPFSVSHVFRSIMEAVRGIAATPILGERGEALGVICVFDVEPLALGVRELEAFRELAHRAAQRLQDALGVASQELFQEVAPDAALTAPLAAADVATLSRLALADPLTGLANRRGGELSIDREVARARREARPLSVVFLDVDRFKAINDVDGHLVGDHVLRGVSETLIRVLRRSDLAIRWGGEEFLLILPNVRLTQARQVAERVRVAMQETRFDRSRVTVSGGVAEMADDEEFTAVLKRADDKLRAAKQHGRNRIC